MLALEVLQRCAQQAGFDAVGAARADYLADDETYLQQWLEHGCHGTMQYMERNQDKRCDPRLLLEGTQTVVVVLLNYYKTTSLPEGVPYIALAGQSKCDYHIVMQQHLQQLEILLQEATHNTLAVSEKQHTFCDSAPIFERRWAQRAGLGWIGKNHLLISPQWGSFVHIGILLLNEKVTPYSTPIEEQCGDCTECIKHCPTGALRNNIFDARQCLSYLTIERKEPLEQRYAHLASQHLYGCDACQKACPYNAHLQETSHEDLQMNPILKEMSATDWQQASRRQKLKILRRLARND